MSCDRCRGAALRSHDACRVVEVPAVPRRRGRSWPPAARGEGEDGSVTALGSSRVRWYSRVTCSGRPASGNSREADDVHALRAARSHSSPRPSTPAPCPASRPRSGRRPGDRSCHDRTSPRIARTFRPSQLSGVQYDTRSNGPRRRVLGARPGCSHFLDAAAGTCRIVAHVADLTLSSLVRRCLARALRPVRSRFRWRSSWSCSAPDRRWRGHQRAHGPDVEPRRLPTATILDQVSRRPGSESRAGSDGWSHGRDRHPVLDPAAPAWRGNRPRTHRPRPGAAAHVTVTRSPPAASLSAGLT